MNNQRKRKWIVNGLVSTLTLTATMLAFAVHHETFGQQSQATTEKTALLEKNKKFQLKNLQFQLNPATFELTVSAQNHRFTFAGGEKRQVSNFQETEQQLSWRYPELGMAVKVTNENDHLRVELQTLDTQTKNFSFLNFNAEHYYLPIGEGKSIPATDQNWQDYFQEEQELDLNEALTMSFLAATQKNTSATVIMENNFRQKIVADQSRNKINLGIKTQLNQFSHQQPVVYKIYLTEDNPVAVAKTYQSERIQEGKFKLLKEKEAENPEIKKLIGAQHLYFWQSRILTMEEVQWQQLALKNNDSFYEHMGQLLEKYSEDGREEFDEAIKALKKGEAYKLEKQTILTAFNNALAYPDFYDEHLFTKLSAEEKEYLAGTKEEIPTERRFTINKKLLKEVLAETVPEVKTWGQETSTEIIKEMKNKGLEKAWIGLANWNQGLINPQFIQEATKADYLIGPYDSYQSIHENPSYEWNTAGFKNNAQVFQNKTIMDESGEFIKGFLGKGRKVNQTLIDDELDYRIQNILTKNIPYNSWFLDTDAAGEIYDDFHPEHLTSMEADVAARNKRAQKLTQLGQVIGTETGNDYFNEGMDFAHGLETPVIWGDKEMREDKESPYYLGSYGTMTDGIPDRYGKPVPLKETFRATTIDPVYSIPLYKLVYNQSVITSHHWEWGSQKIKGEEQNRRLREYLYNSPPLLHVNAEVWQNQQQEILENSQKWQIFQSQAINQEMTDFKYLTSNQLVQKTTYGEKISVTANFSDQPYTEGNQTIQPHSALVKTPEQEMVIQ